MIWPFDKNKIIKENSEKITGDENTIRTVTDVAGRKREKDFEKLKLDALKEFDKKVDSLISEDKIWIEQYQRNIKNMVENYDRRTEEFETKVNIVRETLEKNIDARKDIIESLGKVLDFDKVVKYQTSGIIDISNDLGDLRRLDEGNWEIIILAKKIDNKKDE